MTARNSEPYEFQAIILRTTDRAIQITESGDEADAIWLPVSQVEVEPGQRIGGVQWSKVTAPQWLVEQKGLV